MPAIGARARRGSTGHDFGVSWNAEVRASGIVVCSDAFITIDVEAERPDETPPS